ncbi:unnamed protein product, partial [Gongylonema pulchrum]|uniref:TrmE-type G domain-containing protein n=1 Tax=Gongylonema pulchrum TaxID=637853 RepID=A0A183EAP2_9BILA
DRIFLGPRTSTGEDVAEFYVHGSRAVVDCLSDALSQFSNVRHAKAGEFTKRAFYNGKLTLSEVQSLSHLLAAQTQRQRRLALRSNTLGKVMEKVRNQLVEVRASIEASIDFGDDVDFDWAGIRSAISAVIEKLKNIQQRVHRGTVITDGVQIVILGETNVGKSSLFNRIVDREMAIVSNIEGTTRDSLEATLQISSIPVTITDTAGMRSSPLDILEAEGIRRTLKRAKEADILLVVMDSSLCKDIDAEACSLLSDLELREDVRIVIVCNKCDLRNVQHSLDSTSWPIVHVSCITGAGVESLFDVIRQQIDELCPVSDDNALLSRQRHRLLIEEALIALEQTAKVNDAAVIAELLRDATDAVGEVSGAVVTEQILDQIFSSFCIGK